MNLGCGLEVWGGEQTPPLSGPKSMASPPPWFLRCGGKGLSHAKKLAFFYPYFPIDFPIDFPIHLHHLPWIADSTQLCSTEVSATKTVSKVPSAATLRTRSSHEGRLFKHEQCPSRALIPDPQFRSH